MDHHQATAQHRRRQRRRQPLHHDVRRQGKEAEKSDHPNRCLLFLFFRHRTDRRLFCLFGCFFVCFLWFQSSAWAKRRRRRAKWSAASTGSSVRPRPTTRCSKVRIVYWNIFTEFRGLLTGFAGFYWVSWTCTGFRRLLPSFADFYRVSRAFTGFRGLLPSFAGFYWVSRIFTGFRGLLQGFADFYRVSRAFTGFCGLLPGFHRP